MRYDLVLTVIRNSKFAAYAYGTAEYLRAQWARQIGSSYVALQHLCDARRRIPRLDATKKHGQLIKDLIESASCSGAKLSPHTENQLLQDFYRSKRYRRARKVFACEPLADRRGLRHFRENSPPHRQGNLIILKRANPRTGERGVLVLNYTPTFEQFAATFDLVSILYEYRIVFEPSSYRNIEASLFLYSGYEHTHVIECAHPDDQQLLNNLPSSLTKTDLGSGDWMDPNVFSPTQDDSIYDIVMVASWSRLKRHNTVFKALAALQQAGKRPSIALVGCPEELTQQDIERSAHCHGVLEQCQFFERISHDEVAWIVSRSKVAIHFSKAEGTNRASYEAWLCDTPLIVYRHNIGFRMEYVNEQTGLLADDDELASSIDYVLSNRSRFSPRAWLLERSGYRHATKKLNEMLRIIAQDRGEPWSCDIVEKKNAPGFFYVNDKDRLAMEPEYDRLEKFLS